MQRIVIHADDVGMCHGANTAFVELSRLGTISSGSVMVPCPWFAELAALAAADPELDIGVHLTLNAEQHGYRWAPLSRPSKAAGLTDDLGQCWPSVADVRANAHPDAVEAEWRAQIDRAVDAGIAVTHLDAHMGSALAPEWCDRYIALGVEYSIPVLMPATIGVYGPNNHLADVTDDEFAPFVRQAREAGMPIFDVVLETDFGRERKVDHDYPAMLRSADADLVYCAYHPCAPGDVEVIEPGAHHVRVDEYDLFSTADWSAWLTDQPFEVIGMRGLWGGTRLDLTLGAC
ncbi:MAG: ChbG/HpnK family deacetylase [Ilumatobacteraceae bacterium]